jgi:hypothetical protein
MANPRCGQFRQPSRLARSAIYSQRHRPGASTLPQGGPHVLGANLKCSESKRARSLAPVLLSRDGTPATPQRRFWCYLGGRLRDGWEAASLEQNSQSGRIKADAFAGLEHCGDNAWHGERAADRCTVPGSTPNRLAITRTPGLPGVARAHGFAFPGEAIGGHPRRFSLIPDSRKAGTAMLSPLHWRAAPLASPRKGRLPNSLPMVV